VELREESLSSRRGRSRGRKSLVDGTKSEEKQHQTRAIAASICFVMEEEEEDLRTVLRTGGVAAHKRVASHAFTLVRTFLGRRVRCRQFTSLYSSSESVMETAIPASFLSA
jgi:hypothetical protein